MQLSNVHAQQMNEAIGHKFIMLLSFQMQTNAAFTFLLNTVFALTEYVDLANLLSQLEKDITQFIHGKIPRSLITPSMLQPVLDQIQNCIYEYDILSSWVIKHLKQFIV